MASERLPPRPGEERGGVTKIGALREQYSATVEGRPPMFVYVSDPRWPGWNGNRRYFEWCARADAWAAEQQEDTP